MSDTINKQSLEKHFDDLLSKDPECATRMAIVRNRMLAGFYPPQFVDACFQNWSPGNDKPPSLAEVNEFSRMYAKYMRGEICMFAVPVESSPHADRKVNENQAVLDKLPELFEASFAPEKGRGADKDGCFRWKRKIGINRLLYPELDRTEQYWLEPGTLPLEVGYTHVSKTFQHLVYHRGVARWPYGYSEILVLVQHPSFFASMMDSK